MSSIALIDKNGWVVGRVLTECSCAPEDYPGFRHVPLKPEEENMARMGLGTFHDGTNFRQIKNPKDIWRRLRASSFHGDFCRNAFTDHLEVVRPDVAEIGADISMGIPTPVPRPHPPLFVGEIKPGINIEVSTEDHLNLWEREMISSGMYGPETAWVRAATWLADPWSWPVASMWRGEILQVEHYQFSPGSQTVFCGFTTHIDKERPHWLWRQLAKPVFKALRVTGKEEIRSIIRGDRRDWAEVLKANYGAEEFEGPQGQGISLRYKIKDSLTLAPEWPYRRTVQGWAWEHNGITIREGAASDLDRIKAWSQNAGGVWSSKDKLPRMIDKWIEIDNATVLLAIEGGILLDVWLIRPRGQNLSGVVSLGLNNSSRLDEIRPGMQKWQRDNGFTHSSFFVKTDLSSMPIVKKLRGVGWVTEKEHKHFEHPMTEYRIAL